MDFGYSAVHICKIKNALWHLRYFPLSFWLMHCWPALHFNSYSHFIYTKICQVNALRGDDLAVANSNL